MSSAKRALIIGANGFAGQHLKAELKQHDYDVFGADITALSQGDLELDVLNRDAMRNAVHDIKPNYIYYLAAQASVSQSWADPRQTFNLNINGSLNLLEVLRAEGLPARTLFIGSSEQYGLLRPEDCPITESFRTAPLSPYAISKQAQEQLVLAYIRSYGIDAVLTRSFNHFGPGQRKGFVVADFASQIASIEKGAEPVISVGNIDVLRDFSDIRDVAFAYRLLTEKGICGEIYNVGSGNVYSIRDLLQVLLSTARVPIEIRNDPDKYRPSDLPVIWCSNEKLKAHTGWAPSFKVEQTLLDTLNYWRSI